MQLLQAMTELLPLAFAVGMVVLVIALLPSRRKESHRDAAAAPYDAPHDVPPLSSDQHEA